MLYQNKYRVESARRPGWDYGSDGFTFVTICTRGRYPYFGEIRTGNALLPIVLSDIGRLAQRFWLQIPRQFPCAELDEYVIMPNHLHGIIQIRRDAIYRVSQSEISDKPHAATEGDAMNRVSTVSEVVRWFKGRVTFEAKQMAAVVPFAWQTRFHDRVIRDEMELERIRQYIRDNPFNWQIDEENRP